MSFPWEPAIPQAMQQHGGRNRMVAARPAPPAAEQEAAAAPLAGNAPPLQPADPIASEDRSEP